MTKQDLSPVRGTEARTPRVSRLLPLASLKRSVRGTLALLFLGFAAVAGAPDTLAQSVTAVSITSNAGSDNTYGLGDVISVRVTFNQPVSVTGTPGFTFRIGSGLRRGSYAATDSNPGASSGSLVFKYTVAAGDRDYDGISDAGPESISLSGGRIRNSVGSANANLDISSHRFRNAASHKVDSGTDVHRIAIASTPQDGGAYGAGEQIEVRVHVNTLSIGADRRRPNTPRVVLTFGTGTQTQTRYAGYAGERYSRYGGTILIFRYTVVAGDNDPDGISIGANAVELNGGRFVFTTRPNYEVPLRLFHPAVPADRGQKVDTPPASALAVPLAPDLGGVTVSVSGQTLGFSWTAQAADPARAAVTGYRVERSDDGSTGWTAVGSNLPAPAMPGTTRVAFSEANVPRGTTRHYRVFALSASGDSPASVTVRGTVPADEVTPPPPPPPTTAHTVPSFVDGNGAQLSIARYHADRAPVGTAAATDADGDALTYRLASGGDNALFTIDDTGLIRVRAGTALAGEGKEVFTLTAQVSDGEDTSGLPETTPAIDDTLTVTVTLTDATVAHSVPLLPAAGHPHRDGVVRVINRSVQGGEVSVTAFDDAGMEHGPLTFRIGANAVVHFTSADLEEGNPDKGLSGGVGDGEGAWRLELTAGLDLEVLSYARARNGGAFASLHDVVPEDEAGHRVVFFNPASNLDRVSWLRFVNPGEAAAAVRISGVDDAGEAGESAVELILGSGASRSLSAQALESGEGEGLTGALGDGAGKWRLRVTADQPIQVMSLLSSGPHLTNVSTAPGGP